MTDSIATTFLLISFGILVIAWVLAIFMASYVHVGWVAAIALMGPVSIPFFAFQHWQKGKIPFGIWAISWILIVGSLFIPAHST